MRPARRQVHKKETVALRLRAHSTDVADPETELMLRVAGGDDRAFEALVHAVLPRLMGYFRRMGARRSEAEDFAQETLMKVYRARSSYVAKAKFTTYLFRIARNHWIDVLRHRRIQPKAWSMDQAPPGDEEGSSRRDVPGREPTGATGVRRQELGDLLEAAVASLRPEHQEIFVLSQVEGLRYQEIGAILGIPVGTVKSRVHAAVQHLRAWLRERGSSLDPHQLGLSTM